ncbi:HEAT repeat domain-containing protein [Candidatus Poribacteria bacterium]|nr:HEAT repeat domain-containing protein [Candidatus Poribacteria bacterium]
MDKVCLLDDEGMRNFIINGYITVQTDFPADFHKRVYQQTEAIFEKEGNPGNEILPKVQALQEVFDHPAVRGVLTGILGPNYIMHPHRHCHLNPPGSRGQNFHQDSYEDDENVRHHRSRWAMAFYYPQDVTEEMGPTAVLPGSQYYNTRASADAFVELPLCGKAGTVTIVHYDLWHRAMANRSDQKRFMLKFLFCRMEEPQAPSWKSEQPRWLAVNGGSSSAPHQAMWRHLWNWFCGGKSASDESVHLHAADALGVRGTSARGAIPALIRALRDESEAVRLNAAYALGAIGEPAVPALIEALREEAEVSLEQNLKRSHTNPSQLYSVYALSTVGEPAVPALIETLRDEKWWVRAAAADILGDIGRPAKATVSALIEALRDESEWVRRNATEALGTIGLAAQDAVPVLIDLLSDQHSWVRHNAVSALARMGSAAQVAVPALNQALSDENRYVRGNAMIALRRIQAPEPQLHFT